MTQDKSENERLNLNPIDNNPCGICRANGLAICKGHGGSSDSSDGDPAITDKSGASDKTIPKMLHTSFQENPLWLPDAEEFVFEWHNEESIMSIKADIGTGSVIISGIDGVSDSHEKAQAELLTAIENEFNQFIEELAGAGVSVDGMRATHIGNELKIIIPNKTCYDAFMQRLIDKNLLITHSAARALDVKFSMELAGGQSTALQNPMTALEEIQRRTNIPGIATAMISDKGFTTQSVGVVANAKNPSEVTDSTVFEAASLSKPVFAYIVLKLAKEEKIDLDLPLYKYGDFGPRSMITHPNYEKLTARMILSHQAGLPNEFNPPKVPVDYISPAGEKFDYSGEAYCFLAEVVERVSSKSLEILAQDAFKKIGMTNTSFMPPTGCSLIRFRDEQEPTSETVKNLLENESDKHGQLSIIYHRDKLFVAERAADGSVTISERNSSQTEESSLQKIKARFAEIPEFLWSKPIPIEARELPLVTTIVSGCHLIKMPEKPISDSLIKTNKNQYIIAENELWYFDASKRSIEKLTALQNKSMQSLLSTLKFEENHPATKEELELITSYTGHIFVGYPPKHAATIAIGHYQDGSVNPTQRFYGVHPAGSLYATASDYAKFLNACITEPYIKDEMFKPVSVGCGLIKMSTDPSQDTFENIKNLLNNKDAVILFNDKLYYADINSKTVTTITLTDSNHGDFNSLKEKFTDSYKLVDKIELELITSVTGVDSVTNPLINGAGL